MFNGLEIRMHVRSSTKLETQSQMSPQENGWEEATLQTPYDPMTVVNSGSML